MLNKDKVGAIVRTSEPEAVAVNNVAPLAKIMGPNGKRIWQKYPCSLSKRTQLAVIAIDVRQLGKSSIKDILSIPDIFPDLKFCEPAVAWNFAKKRIERNKIAETFVFPNHPVAEHILLIGPDSTGEVWVDGCYAELPGRLPNHYKLVFQVA